MCLFLATNIRFSLNSRQLPEKVNASASQTGRKTAPSIDQANSLTFRLFRSPLTPDDGRFQQISMPGTQTALEMEDGRVHKNILSSLSCGFF